MPSRINSARPRSPGCKRSPECARHSEWKEARKILGLEETKVALFMSTNYRDTTSPQAEHNYSANKCGLDAEELSHEISTKQDDSSLSLRQGHTAPSLLSCGKVCGVCATGNISARRQNTASGRYGESLLHWGEVDLRRRVEIARGSSCDEKLPRQMIDANSIKITRDTVGRLLNMWFENASIKLNLRIQVFLNRTVRANSSNATWASIVVSGWFFLTGEDILRRRVE
ncbi:hypothetical protein B0H13DRAFT_1870403 [Mycena leptocephala]|nr:hypothetical protein B0H13DRAFT_1870403 [Mycena leptocephala]